MTSLKNTRTLEFTCRMFLLSWIPNLSDAAQADGLRIRVFEDVLIIHRDEGPSASVPFGLVHISPSQSRRLQSNGLHGVDRWIRRYVPLENASGVTGSTGLRNFVSRSPGYLSEAFFW
jgi:putative alpha-1,2-mannosidase